MPKIYPLCLKMSVINFYNSELFTVTNTLNIFNISKSTLYNWINLDKQNLLPSFSNIRVSYKSRITNEIEKYIIIYVTKRCSFNIKNLKKCINRIFNISISKSHIYYILKKNNITNKKIGFKIIPKNVNIKEKVNDLLKKVKIHTIDKIISIDESSFDTHMRPKYGWSKKGTLIKKIINIPKRKRKTLTLAVSNKKIIGYSLVNGSSNKYIFQKFLIEKILPNIKNSVILMDNASFHHSKSVVDCINLTSNKILYNNKSN